MLGLCDNNTLENDMNFNIEIFKRNIQLENLGIGKLSDKEGKLLDFLNKNFTNYIHTVNLIEII